MNADASQLAILSVASLRRDLADAIKSNGTAENVQAKSDLPQNHSDSKKQKLSNAPPSPWLDIVTLMVGPGEEEMIVHAHLIKRIPFFRGCLDAPVQESLTRTICLPDDDPTAVSDLVHFTYFDKLDFDPTKLHEFAALQHKDPWRLINCYYVAKKYLAEKMQNTVMNALVTHYGSGTAPSALTLQRLIRKTEEGEPFRELMMQRVAKHIDKQDGWLEMKASRHVYHKDFAGEKYERLEFIMEAMLKYTNGKRDGFSIRKLKTCTWHVHGETPKCSP
jgi:hypothetical protein